MAPQPVKLDPPLRGRIYDSIAETIGNTPLVRIPRLCREEGIDADICLKLEFFNPIASVKDRIGVSMIEALNMRGKSSRVRCSSNPLPETPASRLPSCARPAGIA